MSNIDLILDALLADIPPNIMNDQGDDVWDALHRLESTLMDRLAGSPDAQAMIDRYREQPDVYASVLAEALVQNNVLDDAQITEMAAEVMALVDPLDADTESEEIEDFPGAYDEGDAGTPHV